MKARYIGELEAQTQDAIDKINKMYEINPAKATEELKSLVKEELENCQSTIRDLMENGPEDTKKSLQQSAIWQDIQNSLNQPNVSEGEQDDE